MKFKRCSAFALIAVASLYSTACQPSQLQVNYVIYKRILNTIDGTYSICAIGDRKALLYGGVDGNIYQCNDNLDDIHILHKTNGTIKAINVSIDKNMYLFATGRGKVFACNTNNDEMKWEITETGTILDAVFVGNGNVLVANSNNSIATYDTNGNEILRAITPCEITRICEIPLHGKAILCGANGYIYVYDLRNGKIDSQLLAHNGEICSITPLYGRVAFATGGQDGKIKMWSLNGNNITNNGELYDHHGSVNSLGVNDENTRLVSGSSDGTIRIWGMHSRKVLQSIQMGEQISCVQYVKDRIVCSGFQSRPIILMLVPPNN